ncbi:MAG: hypothetical protein IJM48_02175, partial [Treponema sp.]|nr:hypothetical protein [Treponema sp.]
MPKKIILSVFVLCASLSFLCASEENSGLLLEKGARFEREGETVYALGAYYDALVENPASLEAYGAYKALSESISSGNPGRDSVDGELELYEEWMALLANAE